MTFSPAGAVAVRRMTSLELCTARPDIEGSAPVLWQMLKAAVFLDATLTDDLARAGRALACGPGCAACCRQAIPVSVAEGAAIRLFLDLAGLSLALATGALTENAGAMSMEGAGPGNNPEGSLRAKSVDAEDDPSRCPFLQAGCCAIYPVRPFACRRFLVFGRTCEQDEDPTVTRPEDMFKPSQKKLFETLCLTLPVYQRLGIAVPDTVTRRFFNDHTYVIQTFPWRLAALP